MELSSYHPSGTYSFEESAKFLENMRTPGLKTVLFLKV
jgi:hypothetical protein